MVAEEGGALKMLEEPLMETATAEIIAGDRSRFDIQRDIKAKVRTEYVLNIDVKST